MTITPAQLEQTVRERFGFDGFRPGQLEALDLLLTQGNLLCIQPTGYGKSLLYQVPACLLDGITLVISPLLALMRDQVGQLQHRFDIPAGCINSDQSDEENDLARLRATRGELKILFVAPEQLDDIERAAFLEALPVSLVVVDEAHCISTWGHDFRPSYRQIAQLVQRLRVRHDNIYVLGLTATADDRCAVDISQQLAPQGDAQLQIMRRSMDRPNLSLETTERDGTAHKLATLVQLIPTLPSPGLIYCATRDNTQIVSDYLTEHGVDVPAYHAGLEPDTKRALQDSFLRGEHRAISATNALGMGIDKSDLRYVLHFDVPGSITAYYQEVGRAGRDGQPAQGFLLFDTADLKIQEHFIQSARPSPDDFTQVMELVDRCGYDEPPSLMTIKRRTGMHPTRVTVVVAELVEQGFLEKAKHKSTQIYKRGKGGFGFDLSRYESQEAVRTRELGLMTRYAKADTPCLMQALRRTLGDDQAKPCGRCSVCLDQDQAPRPDAQAIDYAQRWLLNRPVVIDASKRPVYDAGLALYEGTLRTTEFVNFMRQRMRPGPMPDDTQERLVKIAKRLAEQYEIGAIVTLPSRTWAQREQASQLVAQAIPGASIHDDLLCWSQDPEHRQGELLNNDQRRANVNKNMTCFSHEVPSGKKAILLLDDYIGSGASIKEAVRALRKEGQFDGTIIPLMISRVRWKLGQAGMV